MMKKHISLLICLATALVFSSCNKWLDVQPSTQTDREKLFNTENGFSEAIKGVYTQMCDASLYGRHLTWGLMDVFAGCYKVSYTAPFNAARQYAYLVGDSYVDDPLIGYVETYWISLYNAIAGVNSILDKIDEKEGVFSNDNYDVIKGEAIGLRAFLHFEILRLYADVYEKSKSETIMPYVNELTTLVSPELNGEQVIGEIIAELKIAIELLEKDPILLGTTPSSILASAQEPTINATNSIYTWHNRRFHFNYFAAKATLARAYLWKGEKENALAAALDVIAVRQTHFPWVFAANLTALTTEASQNQDRTFATEHIFALNISKMDELIDGYQNTRGDINNALYLNTTQFVGDEVGLDTRIRYLTTSPTAGNYFTTKYWQGLNTYLYYKARLPLIRISEMYYIAAECSPNWQDGLAYLQEVRASRSIGNVPIAVTSPETLQNEIFREYRKEFIGEGQLWHYYKRHQSATIANMTMFKGTRAYIFPRPESEDLYKRHD